jgi:hypothetical protein
LQRHAQIFGRQIGLLLFGVRELLLHLTQQNNFAADGCYHPVNDGFVILGGAEWPV